MDGPVQRKAGSPWTPLLIAILATPVTGVVIFWTSLYGIAALSDSWHPVWFGDSSYAQIVVLNPADSQGSPSAELIAVSGAAAYSTSHPGCTFLIPIDRKDEVQERLKTDLKLSWFTFDIKPLADGQEEITLYFMDRTDDSHGSRYKASKDRVQLERYRYADDRGGIGVILFAMIFAFGIHVLVLGSLLVRAIYLWRKKRRLQDLAMAGT